MLAKFKQLVKSSRRVELRELYWPISPVFPVYISDALPVVTIMF